MLHVYFVATCTPQVMYGKPGVILVLRTRVEVRSPLAVCFCGMATSGYGAGIIVRLG